MTDILQTEFEWFLANQAQLVTEYASQYLVIKDKTIQGAFPTEAQAYAYGTNTFELGTFLIQECIPGDTAYSQTFHSRVIF